MLEYVAHNHGVPVLAPHLDLFNGDPAGRPIRRGKAREYNYFLHIKPSGSTGKAKIQIQVCDNDSGDNPVAIPFRYRKATSGTDEFGAITDATASTGFETTVTVEGLYQIIVRDDEVHQTAGTEAETKEFIRPKCTETGNEAVVGSMVCHLADLRFEQQTQDTFLA